MLQSCSGVVFNHINSATCKGGPVTANGKNHWMKDALDNMIPLGHPGPAETYACGHPTAALKCWSQQDPAFGTVKYDWVEVQLQKGSAGGFTSG